MYARMAEDPSDIIKSALTNLQSDMTTIGLMKQIIEHLNQDQKIEILKYFEYSVTENEDVAQYKKIIEETKAERIKLQNANR